MLYTNRMKYLIALLIFVCCIGFTFAQDDYQFLIKVHYSSSAELEIINQLGLDIWESHPGEFLVYARQKDLDNLANNKIDYTVLKSSKAVLIMR